MSEFNDVTCPTCGHTYGYHAWQEMQQQREEMETARHIRDFAKLTREVHKRQQAEIPEPTIDDLLKWLETMNTYLATRESDIPSTRESAAIRAILEQHREQLKYAKPFDWNQMKLETIHAFVDRVEARVMLPPHPSWRVAWSKELAKMEKESK